MPIHFTHPSRSLSRLPDTPTYCPTPREKDKLAEQHKHRASEIDEVEQELQRLRVAAQAGLQESVRELENERFQYDEQVKRCRAEKSQYNHHIVQTLELVTAHKAYLGDRLKSIADFAQRQHDALVQEAKLVHTKAP